jgi:hypothetical protein
LLVEIVIGFVESSYTISESGGQQEVCAEVKSGNLQTTIEVEFSTADGDATGKFILSSSVDLSLLTLFSDVQRQMTTLQVLPLLPSLLLGAKPV